ncbi:MAG: hypothetical protein ACRC35_09830 [Angustibacter sp.]
MAGVLAGIGLLLAGFGWWVWSVNAVDPSDYGPPPQPGVAAPNAPSPPPASVTAPGGTPTRDKDALEAVPKQARAHTLEGAQAFAEFYEAQVARAWMKPDPELLRPYAMTSCRSCKKVLGNAENLRAKIQRYDTASSTVIAATYLPESNLRRAFVAVNIIRNKANVVGVDGRIVERISQKKFAAKYEVVWIDDRWLTKEIFLLR